MKQHHIYVVATDSTGVRHEADLYVDPIASGPLFRILCNGVKNLNVAVLTTAEGETTFRPS